MMRSNNLLDKNHLHRIQDMLRILMKNENIIEYTS